MPHDDAFDEVEFLDSPHADDDLPGESGVAAPLADRLANPSNSRTDVETIVRLVKAERGVMLSILASVLVLLAIVLVAAVNTNGPPGNAVVVTLVVAMAVAAVAYWVFIFRLAKEVSGSITIAVIATLLSMLGFVTLLVLICLGIFTTIRLNEAGVKRRFLGNSEADIRRQMGGDQIDTGDF